MTQYSQVMPRGAAAGLLRAVLCVLCACALGAQAACTGSTSDTQGPRPGQPVALVPITSSADQGAAAEVLTGPVDEAELAKAIGRFRITLNRGDGPVRIAGADLTGDGRIEALVLFAGDDWCSPTGCSFAVFQSSDRGYKPVSRTVSVRAPIRVGPGTTAGWRDLIIRTGGGPSPERDVRLAFSGNGYPENALLQPEPTFEVMAQSTEILSASDFGVRDAAALPAR